MLGVVVVTACYIGLNAVYLRVLSIDTVVKSTRVAADAFDALVGSEAEQQGVEARLRRIALEHHRLDGSDAGGPDGTGGGGSVDLPDRSGKWRRPTS